MNKINDMHGIRTFMKSCPSSLFSFSITDNASPNETRSRQANFEEERSTTTRSVQNRSRHFADNQKK